jgi:hypothetical protein
MTKFVVTQTQQEYTAYQKKQEREANQRGWIAAVIGLSFLAGLCYWLQP